MDPQGSLSVFKICFQYLLSCELKPHRSSDVLKPFCFSQEQKKCISAAGESWGMEENLVLQFVFYQAHSAHGQRFASEIISMREGKSASG